jgi:hypothetical protein
LSRALTEGEESPTEIVKSYYDEVGDVVGETPLAVTDVRIGPF